jgi:hypothetical protein
LIYPPELVFEISSSRYDDSWGVGGV